MMSFSANATNAAIRIHKLLWQRSGTLLGTEEELVSEPVLPDGRASNAEVAEVGCSTVRF